MLSLKYMDLVNSWKPLIALLVRVVAMPGAQAGELQLCYGRRAALVSARLCRTSLLGSLGMHQGRQSRCVCGITSLFDLYT